MSISCKFGLQAGDASTVKARRFHGERGEGSGGRKNRIESESEEEFDSEPDISVTMIDVMVTMPMIIEICSIFEYDKREHRDEDFDDQRIW